MKTIDDHHFKGQKALIRVDFNVPFDGEYNITDTSRIDAAIPTVKKILGDEGSAILMSHLGRPKEGPEEKFSLKHLIDYLSKELDTKVAFASDCVGEEASEKAASLEPGEVLLLENLRFHKEETKGDRDFAGKLASLADVYVNDAFGTAHRAHASTAIVAEFFEKEKFFGYIMAREIRNISKVMENPERPFTAVLGGAKVSGKIEVIRNILDKVDHLLIGGGMMFTFIKAMDGEVGDSIVEEDLLDVARETLKEAASKNVTVHIPEDAIIADEFDNEANRRECPANAIPEGWKGLDVGPKTLKTFGKVIMGSRTLLWNGPMGVFEMENFAEGTREVAVYIAKATNEGAYSLVGGGDSVAALAKYGLKDSVSFVSTGGGAMLEYIEGKKLPGIKAVEG